MIDQSTLVQLLRTFLDGAMNRSMHDSLRFMKSVGLTMPQFNILLNLYYRPPCSMSIINERLGISAAATSQLVDKLVQNKFVERTEDPNDRRSKVLALTAEGKALIENGLEARALWVSDLASQVPVEEYEHLATALNSLTVALHKIEKNTTIEKNTQVCKETHPEE